MASRNPTARRRRRRAPARRPTRRRWSAKQIFAGLAAAVAVLAGVTSLVDWVAGKVSAPPPARIDTRIAAVGRQGPQTLRAYLEEAGQATRGYTAAQLRQKGLVFAVRVEFEGGRRQRFPLRWSMADAGGDRLPGPSYNQEPAIFRPRNDDHRRTWPVWVPYPPRAGRFFVTFVLDDQDHRPLAERTVRFR